MWSSTLPTRTVRNEGRSSRTFPQQSIPQPGSSPSHPPQEPDPTISRDHHSRAELRAEADRLKRDNQQAEAEIQRLESQVDLLRTQLADRNQSQQAIVDRYEQVISELESAAATAPPKANADRSADGRGLIDRLTAWLF